MNIGLWILQSLLALMFLFAGGTKLVLPISTLMAGAPPNTIHLPELFLRFIGACEFLGGLGLILPGVFRIRTGLTPLAATGLLIIMIGAVVVTIIGPGVKMAIAPIVTGVLLLFVAYGRWRLVPHSNKSNSK